MGWEFYFCSNPVQYNIYKIFKNLQEVYYNPLLSCLKELSTCIYRLILYRFVHFLQNNKPICYQYHTHFWNWRKQWKTHINQKTTTSKQKKSSVLIIKSLVLNDDSTHKICWWKMKIHHKHVYFPPINAQYFSLYWKPSIWKHQWIFCFLTKVTHC